MLNPLSRPFRVRYRADELTEKKRTSQIPLASLYRED